MSGSTLLLEDVADYLSEAKVALLNAVSRLQQEYRDEALLFKLEDIVDTIVRAQNQLPDHEPDGGFEAGDNE